MEILFYKLYETIITTEQYISDVLNDSAVEASYILES